MDLSVLFVNKLLFVIFPFFGLFLFFGSTRGADPILCDSIFSHIFCRGGPLRFIQYCVFFNIGR